VTAPPTNTAASLWIAGNAGDPTAQVVTFAEIGLAAAVIVIAELEVAKTSLPIPRELGLELSATVARWGRRLRRHRPHRPADLDVGH
jgi:hypothetical protein